MDVLGGAIDPVRPRIGRGRPARAARPRGDHVVQEIAGALVTRMNLGRHRLHDDIVDGLRDPGVLETRVGDEIAAHQAIHVVGRRRVVRQHAGQHLIHGDAERVDVGSEHRPAVKLLGRHVWRAADDRRAVRGNLEKARRSEIGHLEHPALGDDHIGRPEVAVEHTLAVRVVDGVADLTAVVERARHTERAFARDHRLERLAGHELHHDEEDVLLLLRREDRDDVRVVERREQPRLAQQLAEVEVLFVRDLERDLLVDPGVFREVDGAEAAAADRGQNLVFAQDLSAEEHAREVYQSRMLHHENTKDAKVTEKENTQSHRATEEGVQRRARKARRAQRAGSIRRAPRSGGTAGIEPRYEPQTIPAGSSLGSIPDVLVGLRCRPAPPNDPRASVYLCV